MSLSALKKPFAALARAYVPVADMLSAIPAAVFRPLPVECATGRRIAVVQFGDYADAYWRIANGGKENYYAQKYTMDFMASIAADATVQSLTIVSASDDVPESTLPNKVRVAGIKLYPAGRPPAYARLINLVRRTRPTHLIAMTPCISLISWAVRNRISVLPMFADSFRATGIRASLNYRLLSRLLNVPAIGMVGNHNLAASLDLQRIGVDTAKIFPFDWPPLISPQDFAPKDPPPEGRPFRLIFVGAIMETKGIGDAIRAVAVLGRRGLAASLSIIGKGDFSPFEQLVREERVEDRVTYLGPKPHPEVVAAMRDHDAVLVPSHWAYPEGLPMTLYEALCTRTPLVTSDHPMFALKIRHLHNAVVFQERNPERFADAIQNLATDPALYRGLSAAGASAADDYLCPLKYDQLISGFLSPTIRAGLLPFSLQSHQSRS